MSQPVLWKSSLLRRELLTLSSVSQRLLASAFRTMKKRITFLHDAEDAFKPEQLRIEKETLYVKSLKAAREDRVTASLYELPQEVRASRNLTQFPSLRRAVMEGIETMPRTAHTLGLRKFVSIYLSLRLHGFSGITCLLHSTEEQVCVCKQNC